MKPTSAAPVVVAVAAGATTSALFARTGPGAVFHALCTATATVVAFVACYAPGAAVRAAVARWRHRLPRAERRAARQARRPLPAPELDAPDVLEPAGTLTLTEIEEHWSR